MKDNRLNNQKWDLWKIGISWLKSLDKFFKCKKYTGTYTNFL